MEIAIPGLTCMLEIAPPNVTDDQIFSVWLMNYWSNREISEQTRVSTNSVEWCFL